jgi:endonuclease G, mitochondrial
MKLISILLLRSTAWCAGAAELKPIVLDPAYKHDKYETRPADLIREFQAFTVSFDSADDDSGDGIADVWAIPEWVAYEIKRYPGVLPKSPERPDWMTDKILFEAKIAPADASYHFAKAWSDANPKSRLLGYDRGHMCMKQHAWRMGADADWNTHTVLNACPQRADLNQGIWLDLENKTAKWADKYGAVWIITGPIIYGKEAINWLGQENLDEVMVAIPDAFFKIVVRENPDSPKPFVLAFIYPQRGLQYRQNKDHRPFLTNVDAIEHFTGLDFLTALPDAIEAEVEKFTSTELWEE